MLSECYSREPEGEHELASQSKRGTSTGKIIVRSWEELSLRKAI